MLLEMEVVHTRIALKDSVAEFGLVSSLAERLASLASHYTRYLLKKASLFNCRCRPPEVTSKCLRFAFDRLC